MYETECESLEIILNGFFTVLHLMAQKHFNNAWKMLPRNLITRFVLLNETFSRLKTNTSEKWGQIPWYGIVKINFSSPENSSGCFKKKTFYATSTFLV